MRMSKTWPKNYTRTMCVPGFKTRVDGRGHDVRFCCLFVYTIYTKILGDCYCDILVFIYVDQFGFRLTDIICAKNLCQDGSLVFVQKKERLRKPHNSTMLAICASQKAKALAGVFFFQKRQGLCACVLLLLWFCMFR